MHICKAKLISYEMLSHANDIMIHSILKFVTTTNKTDMFRKELLSVESFMCKDLLKLP